MNYPIWDLQGSGLLIAVVSIVHVFVSHFAVGGGLFLVLTERRARRTNDPALLGFVRYLSRFFILLTLVFGAITGVGIWFAITLVSPWATASLINTFVWGWAIEWTFFLTEIAAAMVYYYGWDRLSARTHLAVGWIYFWAAWLSLVIINGILAYMLTPGAWLENRGFWSGFFNPTYFPSLFARTFAAIGLAGLYAVFTAGFLRDPQLKRTVARWAGTWWVLPMVIALPLSLAWYFAAASSAGVPVAEIFGSGSPGFLSLVASAFGPLPESGYPMAQRALKVALAAMTAALAVTLFVLLARSERYGRVSGALLLLSGLFAIGGAEWVREGLRKPWVIGEHMFVNGVRVPPRDGAPRPPEGFPADRYTVEALDASGVLAASPWARLPAGYAPGALTTDAMDPKKLIEMEAAAGREIFRLQCFACHSYDRYNGIAKLVKGKSSATIEGILGRLARPVNARGEAALWTDPQLALKTWRDRMMPPFVGTAAEAHALSVYLATLGGGAIEAAAPPATGPPSGAKLFEDHCAMCHAPESDFPMANYLRGQDADAFYAAIGRLPELNELMPPFEGTDAERRALAEYLAGLGQPAGAR